MGKLFELVREEGTAPARCNRGALAKVSRSDPFQIDDVHSSFTSGEQFASGVTSNS